jgi:hypothetical protein
MAVESGSVGHSVGRSHQRSNTHGGTIDMETWRAQYVIRRAGMIRRRGRILARLGWAALLHAR